MNLLFHQAALGDFVLTFPLLRALEGPTTVIAPWSRAALAARVFDHVTPMDIELWEFTRLHVAGGPTSVSPAVGELFAAAHRIISFISRPDDAWAANAARLAPRATITHIIPRPPAGYSRHVTAWHRQQLPDLAPSPPKPDGEPREPSRVSPTPAPIVLHPGSGGRDKCWPIDRFEAVLDALRNRNHQVLPILGEAEVDRWPHATVHRWRTRYDARVPRCLDELCDLLANASLYLGNDAGPTHLAAWLGIPTVALFGPTDPGVWAPLGPRVTVLAPPTPRPMDWLPIDTVVAAARIDQPPPQAHG